MLRKGFAVLDIQRAHRRVDSVSGSGQLIAPSVRYADGFQFAFKFV